MNIQTNTHHTKLKGDTALQAVIFDLIKKGYFVSTPISENCPYDLIVDCGTLYKIQVKYRSNGMIPHRTTWSDKNGIHTKDITGSEFDYFALVSEDFSKIAYCPISMKGSTIRFEIPTSFTPFYYYIDFLTFGSIPNKHTIKEFKSDEDIGKMIRDNNMFGYNTVAHQTKINWPSDEQLSKIIFEKPTKILAKELGVSDTAIGKYCKKKNIAKPPRGYWTKFKSNPLN